MKDSLITQEEIKYLMANYLNTLTEREKKVISLRYNTEGEVQQTLSEIAVIIHRTRERVRQIIIRCIKKMRYRRKIQSLSIKMR